MKHLHMIILVCILAFVGVSQAKPKQQHHEGIPYQGVIESLSLEEGKMKINGKEYALSTGLIVLNKNQVHFNQSVLAAGQFIEFWIKENAPKINSELNLPVMNQIKILSQIDSTAITH